MTAGIARLVCHRLNGSPASTGFCAGCRRNDSTPNYVEARRVHRALPFIEWERVRYSVPPDCLGQLVEVRQRVDSNELTVRCAGRLVATHRIVTDGRVEVWDPAHRATAEASALASTQRRRDLHIVRQGEPPALASVGRISLPGGDFEVATPDLATRYDGGDLR